MGSDRTILQLRHQTARLYRMAYPDATPNDAWDWRLKVAGIPNIDNWETDHYVKAIKELEGKLGVGSRRKRLGPAQYLSDRLEMDLFGKVLDE